jgi:hypothetical protein
MIVAYACVPIILHKIEWRKKNFQELFLWTVNSDDNLTVELVWQE